MHTSAKINSMTTQPERAKAPLFVIGDIHGCAPELHRLLAALPLTADSTIVFLGDYVDRGNYNSEVIETVIQLAKHYNVIALRGNHEEMFLQFLNDESSPGAASFIFNGGSSTLANYANEDGAIQIPPEHLEFLQNTRLYYEVDHYFFVHAGLPFLPLAEIDFEKERATLLWARYPFVIEDYNFGKIIVHGHTRVPKLEVRKYRIAVDTGCVFGNKLSAIELHSRKIFTIDKMDKNEPRVLLRDKISNRIARRFSGKILVVVLKGKEKFNFETLNYSEFGFLISESAGSSGPSLAVGEKIIGAIGNQEHSRLKFKGTVIRREDRDGHFLYGVKLDKVADL